jgi:asparagine synthase (glutamine-hydrolysing)
MSAIFGVVYFDDRPKAYIERSLKKMVVTMESWAPDGITQMILEPAGFALGLLSLQPEDRYLSVPALSENQNHLFTCSARLDNRDELCDIFDIHSKNKAHTPDAKLVQLAEQKWGHDAAQHLYGDWAYAVFNKVENRVTAARDHIGNTAFYYYFDSRIFAFASSPKALLALDEVPTDLDEYNIACDLARFPELDAAHRTKWQAIRLLLPAQKLTVNADSIHINTYWSLENVKPVRYKNEEDYFEDFRERMAKAVKVRLRGNTGIASSLSSGLDSGTITSLAAKKLQQNNKDLLAYTSIPAFLFESESNHIIYDEWEMAHNIAEKYENINHIPINSKETILTEQLKKIVLQFGDTLLSPGNAFWIFDMLRHAHQTGAGIFLTGQLGNGGISWYGGKNRVLYQLLSANPGEGIDVLKESVTQFGIPWKKALKFYILSPFYIPLKEKWVGYKNPDNQLYSNNSPILQKFAKRVGLDKSIKQSNFYGYKNSLIRPMKERVLTMTINSNYTCASWHRYGAMFDLEVRDPSADVRLLEFCFGIPESFHAEKTKTRLLIRNSMKKIVPDKILTNQKRGKQAADLGERFLHQIDEISSEVTALKKIEASDEYLDLTGIENSLIALKKENPENVATHSMKILNGLMFGYFLKHHSNNY